jgi:integrase
MSASNRLTELAVKSAKPSEKVRKLTDGGGMYLLVHPNGSKYWRLDTRIDGKQKTLSFGVWPEVSLSEAREQRDEAKKKVKGDINPIEERWEQKRIKAAEAKEQQQREEVQGTPFEKVAHEWMQRQERRWTSKHAFDVRRGLENHVFPEIGATPITELGTKGVLDALRKIEAQGKHEAASRARQRCEKVFGYGIITGQCEHNPAAGLRDALTPPRKKPQPALKPDELPEFLNRLEDYDGHMLTKFAMWFMLYTFVRTKELRLAEWNQFELEGENPTWTIPAATMKMRREHLVPLSFQAIEVLEQVQEFSGPDGLVFPQQDNPHKPMSENTMLFALYRMGYHSRATTHGFRATASTILNESGQWHPDAIERQLAHVEGNKVRAAYGRSLHLEQRRKMMQWWADHLDSLMIPADVIDLQTMRQRRSA